MDKKLIIKKDDFVQEDWYHQLKEECEAIITERDFNARMEIVEGKWELGQKITQTHENMDRKKIYGKKIIENLSNDIGVSSSNLFSTVQFYKQFPEETFELATEKFPWGKETSWYKITQKYLGSKKEKEEQKKEEDEYKQKFKLKEVLEIFKIYLIDDVGVADEEEIKNWITGFKKFLVKKGRKK